MLNRISTYLYLRPKLVLALLLLPPLIWFLVVYIGSLITLLINSFFSSIVLRGRSCASLR